MSKKKEEERRHGISCRSLLEFVLTTQYTVSFFLCSWLEERRNRTIKRVKEKKSSMHSHLSYACLLSFFFFFSSIIVCFLALYSTNSDGYVVKETTIRLLVRAQMTSDGGEKRQGNVINTRNVIMRRMMHLRVDNTCF